LRGSVADNPIHGFENGCVEGEKFLRIRGPEGNYSHEPASSLDWQAIEKFQSRNRCGSRRLINPLE
jgi:hypothetical protein